MNFNLFDDMNGMILHERENVFQHQNNMKASGNGTTGNTSRFPASAPLAMAYVPFQQWGEIYSEDEAFGKGTLFPELVFPFERGGGRNE